MSMSFRLPAAGTLPATLALLAALAGCSPAPSDLPGSPTDSSPPGSGQTQSAVSGSSSRIDASDLAAASSADVPLDVSLTVADLSQLEQFIAGHAGKVVVVDVWSTSCAPCMREFPHLVELSQTHPERLACISLNVDYIGLKSKPPENYMAKVEKFLQDQNAVDITNLLSTTPDEAVLRKFSIGAIPAILIYSVEGELKHTLTDSNTGEDGLTYEGDVLPKVRELLPTS